MPLSGSINALTNLLSGSRIRLRLLLGAILALQVMLGLTLKSVDYAGRDWLFENV